jgi:hypothetical protein
VTYCPCVFNNKCIYLIISSGQQEFNPTKYPETMSAFADGIKSDFFDMFSTGASALGSTVRLFFPMHSVTDDATEDSLNEIEVTAPAPGEGGMTPLKGMKNKNTCNTSSPFPRQPMATHPPPSPLKQKIIESQAAIRMRCSNLWNESNIAIADKSSSSSSKCLDVATHGQEKENSSEMSQAKRNNAKAQKGGKVLLSKLAKNASIQVFTYLLLICYFFVN